ncbi:MAG: long-chain fatty acid--CoA ligase [Rhodothermales bacterium]|nr:long-chain fatty acid--CoA ligase [Rhodothermales bacterium]
MSEQENIAKHVGKPSYLGRTLPSLLYRAQAVYPNPSAFVQWTGSGWKHYTTDEFRVAAEELAVGLRESGLSAGDRVAFYVESDVYFCLADMACLIAGLVDVPIYLTHNQETIEYVIGHAEAHAVIVTGGERLGEMLRALEHTDTVHTVIGIDETVKIDPGGVKSGVTVTNIPEIRRKARAILDDEPDYVRRLADMLEPNDLATLIYTSGTTGRPKGVMLTHENISSNALTAYAGLREYRPGADGEIMLSFLPLTHIFARTLYYGALAHGTSLYFSHPDRLVGDLKDVRPTVMATVPRVLEKIYARIQQRSQDARGVKGRLARWALEQARETKEPGLADRARLKLADRLVYRKWREVLGGRMNWIIAGGAALSEEISRVFDNAGIQILQGYGLTETSPVIAFNRPEANRHGTVGQPLPIVEVRIADDGEILTRGPHVMAGYFRDDERTSAAIDEDGWFHTGDIGVLSADGFLSITDRKKDLFKLSTGKYVMPQPLENRLTEEPFIDHAVVIGSGHKFASALLFPNPDELRRLAGEVGAAPNADFETLCEDESIRSRVFDILAQMDHEVPEWATIKRFRLVPGELTVENDMLTPTLKVRRPKVKSEYEDVIASMYADEHDVADEPTETQENI